MTDAGWVVYGWIAFLGGMFAAMNMADGTARPIHVVAVLLWPIGLPVWMFFVVADYMGLTERGKIERRIRIATRDQKLLERREKANAEEAKVRSMIEAYIKD